MPQFDVNFYYSQIFWLAVIFSSLYFIVYKFIVPLAKRISDNRQLSIDINIADAKDLASKAKDLQQQYDDELQKIQNLVENTQKEALICAEEAFLSQKNRLNIELKTQIANNSKKIEEDYKLFWADKNQISINLARMLVQKITNQPVNMELLNKLYKKIT